MWIACLQTVEKYVSRHSNAKSKQNALWVLQTIKLKANTYLIASSHKTNKCRTTSPICSTQTHPFNFDHYLMYRSTKPLKNSIYLRLQAMMVSQTWFTKTVLQHLSHFQVLYTILPSYSAYIHRSGKTHVLLSYASKANQTIHPLILTD